MTRETLSAALATRYQEILAALQVAAVEHPSLEAEALLNKETVEVARRLRAKEARRESESIGE